MPNPGDSNRITREYLDSLLLEMRHIDAVMPDTTLSLYGETFATPVMTAALSHLNSTHPDGMVELARGAKLANAVMWAGMGDIDEFGAIAKTGARSIKIIKPYQDDADIYARIAHAESVGALAVGIDLDHAFNRQGEFDVIHGLHMRPKSSAQIADFVKSTRLPFILKGVLSVKDAEKCAALGVRGIVVSHHHGLMDYALPPLKILPYIVKAVGGVMPIFVDCEISRGMDVFKCLALGATAASVGRALMPPLKENGAQGVATTIDQITRELKHAMGATASPDIRSIDPSVIGIRD